MATTADSYSVQRAPVKAPISTHPAFPAIAALWFAALLGIGSLVLPVALIERFVSATGLAAMLPAAAPPLGFTARAGIALAGAIAGALVGLVLARKVAEAHAPEPKARPFKFEEARQCRPILAHDELGEEGLESEPAPAQTHRRRALAITEDNARSTYLQTVPLPGLRAGETLAFAPLAEATPPAARQPEAAEAEPLELAPFADLGAIDEDEDEAPELAANAALDALRSRIHTSLEPPFSQDPPMTDLPSSDIPAAFEPAADPLPFAPPSLRRAETVAFDDEEVDETPHGSFDDGPQAPHLSIIEDVGEPEATDDDRPLAELGLVQLAARLGASLAKRKARLAHPPALAPAAVSPLAGAEDFEAAEADDAARAIADFFDPAKPLEPAAETAAPAVPASLRPWPLDSHDDTDDDGIAASFSLPLAKAAVALESVDQDEPAEVEEPAEEAGYSSLLAMKNPFAGQEEFVRVDEPEQDSAAAEPAVTFPSVTPDRAPGLTPRLFDPPQNPAKTAAQAASADGPRDPGDAERNLRAALATLQRMSGAA